MTTPAASDRALARATAALAVLVGLVVALQGCGDDSPAPGPDPTPTESPSVPSLPSPTPTHTAAASASPASAAAAAGVPPAVPRTRAGWARQIPDGFRIDQHVPADGGDVRRTSAGVRADFCGSEAFVAGREVDRLAVSAFAPEYVEVRDLRLFRDARAAHAFVRSVHAIASACPDGGSHGTTWRNEVRRSAVRADEAFTVVRSHYVFQGWEGLGGDFWEVARVGNAVLLTASGGEFDPQTSLDPGIRQHAAEVAGIVEAMCVFAARPCERGPVDGSATHPTVVGPHGLGNIALGASRGEIEAFGGRVTRARTGSGCSVVELWVNDAPDLAGNLQPGLGLAVIHAGRAARSDRGVGTGSPYDEVVAAYPRGEGDRELWSAPVPGYPDRHWRFLFGPDGLVEEFMLLLDAQRCGG